MPDTKKINFKELNATTMMATPTPTSKRQKRDKL